MREVVLVCSVRTPVGRAFKGTLRATRPDELAAIAIKGAVDRVPQLDPKEIEDVIMTNSFVPAMLTLWNGRYRRVGWCSNARRKAG